MKYSIETTDYGCVENLEINGKTYIRRNERTDTGCRALDDEFSEQLENDGFNDEIIEGIYDLFDNFISLDFIQLSEVEEWLMKKL